MPAKWSLKKVVINDSKKVERAPVPEKVWDKFTKECKLTQEQLTAFQTYHSMLQEWNETRNLTSLTSLPAIVSQHFKDSLALRDFFDLSSIKSVADVGTGAGFPGIPLKIVFPHLRVLLIEVSKKKQEFLNAMINELDLDGVEVASVDWRTFLRKTTGEVDLFVTKAAMGEVELARMFRTTSSYRDRTLVYWVSGDWQCDSRAEKFVRRVESYKLGKKSRKLVFLGMA